MGLITRVKDWADREVLTEPDLEAEFDNICDNIVDATTIAKGMVMLEDSHASTSITKAACPKNVKEAYDRADSIHNVFSANTFLYSETGDALVAKTREEVMGLLSGQAMGSFGLNNNRITNVTDPTANQDAATKKYVDDNIGASGISDAEYSIAWHGVTDVGASKNALYNKIEAMGGDDKIFEGNTSIETIDTGDGYIPIIVDGSEIARFSGDNLGIGRIPQYALDIQRDGSSVIRKTSYSNTDYICPRIYFYKARGTAASPTTVMSGDTLFGLQGGGYYGAAFSGTRGSLLFKTSENWDAANQGTIFAIKTTPTGSTTRTERIYIDGSGNIAFGGITPNEKLTVEGNLSLKEGSAPSHTADYGKFYVKSSDSLPYFKTDGGTEYGLTGSSEDWVLFNVMDYGAYKDGTHATETTTAWTNAINAANGAVYSPGVVFAPPGDYLITPGSLPAINCNIYAPGTQIVGATNASGNLFHISHTSHTHRFFTVGMIIGYAPNAKDGSSRTVYLYKLTGTVSVSASSSVVTGSGTSFNSEAAVGDPILIKGEEFTISAVTDNTHLTLSANHVAGASAVIAYMNAKHTGHGLYIDSSVSCTYTVDRIAGFDVGLRLDNYTSNDPVSENVFNIHTIGYNDRGLALNNSSTSDIRIEANRFQIQYMVLNWTYTIHLTARNMCNDNYFEVLNLELHLREGDGIYLDGTDCFRNAFICPNKNTGTLGKAGKIVKTTSGAHDNFFRLAYGNFSQISTSASNVFDLLSNEFQGNFAASEAPPIGDGSGRSQFMRDAAPTGGSNYFRQGDICWNNSPSDGTLCWVCTVSGSPGTWTAKTGGGAGDKISEGNSAVEVIDTGTGHIDFDVDGTERALTNSTYFGIRSDMYLDLSKQSNQGNYYLKRNGNTVAIIAGGQWAGEFYSDHVKFQGDYILVDPSSGNAEVKANGAATGDFGTLRCQSGGTTRTYLSGNNSGSHLGYTGILNFKTVGGSSRAHLTEIGNLELDGTLTENAWTLKQTDMGKRWKLLDTIQAAYKTHDGKKLDPILQAKTKTKKKDGTVNTTYGKRPSDFIQVAIECIADLSKRIITLENYNKRLDKSL